MRVLKAHYEIQKLASWEDMLAHVERCGRMCYKSEDQITPESREAFIRRIIDSGHESVIEHVGFAVVFTVDRGITHELVRHRISSFSQESTRYCNYTVDKFEAGIAVIDLRYGMELDFKVAALPLEAKKALLEIWLHHMERTDQVYREMIALGATPQIARSVLPQSTKASIVVTSNIREWRLILRQRASRAAHPQMREVMVPLLLDLQHQCPIFFNDIPYDKGTAERMQLHSKQLQ